jgi:hypothetical protein
MLFRGMRACAGTGNSTLVRLRRDFWPFLFSTTWPGSFFGSFFPQDSGFNYFSASFSGSFRFVFGPRFFVFNKFSGSFFKKVFFFIFESLKPLLKTVLQGLV